MAMSSAEIRTRLAELDRQRNAYPVPERLPPLGNVNSLNKGAVQELQSKLLSMGLYKGTADGDWSTLTRQAVETYNKKRDERDKEITAAVASRQPLDAEYLRLSKGLDNAADYEQKNSPAAQAKRLAIQGGSGIVGFGHGLYSSNKLEVQQQIKDEIRRGSSAGLARDVGSVDPNSGLAKDQYRAMAETARREGYMSSGRPMNSLGVGLANLGIGAVGRFVAAPALYAQNQDTGGDLTTAGSTYEMGKGGAQLGSAVLNNLMAPQVIDPRDIARFRMAESAAKTQGLFGRDGPRPAVGSAVPMPPTSEGVQNALAVPQQVTAALATPVVQPVANNLVVPVPGAANDVPQGLVATAETYPEDSYLAKLDARMKEIAADPVQKEAIKARFAKSKGGLNASNDNALLHSVQTVLPPASPAPPAAALPPEAAPPAEGEIQDLQARLQSSRDPAEVEALKARIAELQGQIDSQAAARQAAIQKGTVTKAGNFGAARLEAAPVSEAVKRAMLIDPSANPGNAKDILTAENARIIKMSPNELKAALTAEGVATEGLTNGGMMKALMKVRTFAIPAAIATGAGVAALGGNPADSAPQGPEEGMPHYLARRAYPLAAIAPVTGVAQLGGAGLNAGLNAVDAATSPATPTESVMPPDNAPPTLTGNLAAGNVPVGSPRDLSNVPPLPPGAPPVEYADPRFPEPNPQQAEHDMLVQRLAQARLEDARQRSETRLSPGQPSSFDEALENLRQSLIAHKIMSAFASAPNNALLRR